MKWITVSLDLVAFVLGIAAAWCWLKASHVGVRDPYPNDGVSRATGTDDFVLPTIFAFNESARWNKIAARLTAGAVFVGTLGNLSGACVP